MDYLLMDNIIRLISASMIGLCLGSFTHLAIVRFSPKITTYQYFYSIIFVPSKCECCNKILPFSSLIPVLSWLIQRGRCKYCGSSIPLHYPLFELAISFYFIAILIIYSVTIQAVILIMLGLYFLVLITIDYRYLLLPNSFTYPIAFIGLLIAYYNIGFISFLDAVIGLILGYLFLFIPAKTYYLIKQKNGLGGGDIKLLAALSTWVHYEYLPILLLLSATAGIIYLIIIKMIYNIKLMNKMLPFGPFLLISAYAILLYIAY